MKNVTITDFRVVIYSKVQIRKNNSNVEVSMNKEDLNIQKTKNAVAL